MCASTAALCVGFRVSGFVQAASRTVAAVGHGVLILAGPARPAVSLFPRGRRAGTPAPVAPTMWHGKSPSLETFQRACRPGIKRRRSDRPLAIHAGAVLTSGFPGTVLRTIPGVAGLSVRRTLAPYPSGTLVAIDP